MSRKNGCMSFLDTLRISAQCSTVDELKTKDEFVRRFLAGKIINSGLPPDSVPLNEWNDAIELFGGTPGHNAEEARINLLIALDYKYSQDLYGKSRQ